MNPHAYDGGRLPLDIIQAEQEAGAKAPAEALPAAQRLAGLADVFDALTARRGWRDDVIADRLADLTHWAENPAHGPRTYAGDAAALDYHVRILAAVIEAARSTTRV